MLDLAWAGHEVVRVFGVDPALDRVTEDLHVFLLDRQLVASGDAEHLLDDVDTSDHLGDRVLHLNAGVHLDEVETTVFIEELEGAGATVADLDAGIDAALEHFGAGLLVDQRGRSLFDHFLVTALQRAVTVIQVNRVALAVGQHLDFNVARVAEELFQIDHRVAERSTGFGAGQLGRFDQVFFLVYHAHAATTAAASGLDDHRVAHFTGDAQCFFLVFRQRAVGAGNHRYAGFDHGFLGRYLVAHQANGVGFRADEGETGVLHLFGEVGVLGQETVARVNGGSARQLGGTDDRRDVQVRQRAGCRANADAFVGQTQVHQFAVGGGVHGHRLDTQLLAGTQDTQGDLATVGDQDFFQLLHCRLPGHQTMVNRGWSYSTGWPFSTRMDSITPLASASMWFIIFIASTMHRMSPFFTV